jgi:protoporphyrinogen oxidase
MPNADLTHGNVVTGPSKQQRLRIAVIGGGVTGLTAAYDLVMRADVRPPAEVVVYEGGKELGGLAAGFRGRPSWEWPLEHFYHHLFTNDDAIIGLTNELGFGDKLVVHTPVTALYFRGHLYPLDSPVRVLRFPHLPIWDRLRMGAVLGYLRYNPARPWRRYDRIVADQWLARWMGSRAYATVWQPMLQGKFGVHYDQVNLAWFWARIYKRTRQLGYYEGGFQAFVDRLADTVRQRGAAIHTQRPVSQISRTAKGGYLVHDADGREQAYHAALSTVGPGLMGRLAPDLPDDYRSSLSRLRSMGAVVLTVALDRQLMRQVYWANIPKQEGLPFLALVEHTNMIDPAHYDGDHLLYIGNYLDPDHRYFDLSAEELLSEFVPHLRNFNADFDPRWVKGAWVHKAKYAQPVPPVGYADMIPALRTPATGLYYASMSQVYPWDRGTNYAVEMGRKVAGMIVDDMRDGRLQISEAP